MSRNVEDRERKKNHYVKVISIGNRPHPHPAPRHKPGGAVQGVGRRWVRSEVQALLQLAKRLLPTLSSAASSKKSRLSPTGSAGREASKHMSSFRGDDTKVSRYTRGRGMAGTG